MRCPHDFLSAVRRRFVPRLHIKIWTISLIYNRSYTARYATRRRPVIPGRLPAGCRPDAGRIYSRFHPWSKILEVQNRGVAGRQPEGCLRVTWRLPTDFIWWFVVSGRYPVGIRPVAERLLKGSYTCWWEYKIISELRGAVKKYLENVCTVDS